MSRLSMFVPLTKVDAEKRLVYGIATAEALDRSGEVMDYATTKPLYEAWSGDIQKASGGLSKGNLRAMHGKVAAGKLTEITFNDASKQIEICAKVVDDNEWKKVEEGVYTGFSQGGSYVKRWDENGVKKYTAQPAEVSLVDLPCLASATFDMVKADGLVEQRHFAEAVTVVPPSNMEVAAKAAELAKAAGTEEFEPFLGAARDELTKAILPAPEPLDAPAEPVQADLVATVPATPGAVEKTVTDPAAPRDGEDYEQVWKSKRDGKTFASKVALRKYHEKLDAEAAVKADMAPTTDAIAALEARLAKDYDTKDRTKMAATGEAMPDGSFPIANKTDLKNAIATHGMAKNPMAAKRHIKRRAKALDATDMLPDSWKGKAASDSAAKSDGAADLRKDATLYGVSNLISLLGQMEVAENCLEGQGSPYYYDGPTGGTRIPVSKELTDRFGAMLGQFGDLVAEVLDVVLSSMKGREADEATAMAMAFASGDLEKVGARNSKTDQAKIQAMHDHTCALGATCDADNAPGSMAGKAATPEDLAKAADALAKVTIERDEAVSKCDTALAKYEALKEFAADLPRQIADLTRMVAAQPVPAHLVGRAITKAQDTTTGNDNELMTTDQLTKALAEMKPEDRALLMIKVAHTNPQRLGA